MTSPSSLRVPVTAVPTGWDDRVRPWAVQAIVLLVAALLLRAGRFGDPVIQIDEQFYLLVGDRMLHGTLPFVDVWDRKPIGLFLIFAAIRLLGGGGVVQYQVVAALFAAATAFVIARLALRIARPLGALLAGVAYLIWLGVFGGEGGQSPVFYNLVTAVAALLTLRVLDGPKASWGRLAGAGALVMLIAGIDIQIKYTSLFEGVFFGLALLWAALRQGARPLRLIGLAALWVACALLPTGAALLAYARLGQAEAFWFANFTSIFGRTPWPGRVLIGRLWFITRSLLPLLLCAALSWQASERWTDSGRRDPAHAFFLAWALAAVVGLLAFGTYFDHYTLPVLVPLTLVCAPVLGRWETGVDFVAGSRRVHLPLALATLAAGGAFAFSILRGNLRTRGDGTEVAAMVRAIGPRLTNCMFVYDGEPILYYLTGSCFPTRYVFPYHLDTREESRAIGVDPNQELKRVLDGKPNIVVSTNKPNDRTNLETWAIMQGALARDYHVLVSTPVGGDVRTVYERNAS